jgi:hypothetical protein
VNATWLGFGEETFSFEDLFAFQSAAGRFVALLEKEDLLLVVATGLTLIHKRLGLSQEFGSNADVPLLHISRKIDLDETTQQWREIGLQVEFAEGFETVFAAAIAKIVVRLTLKSALKS